MKNVGPILQIAVIEKVKKTRIRETLNLSTSDVITIAIKKETRPEVLTLAG